MPRAVPPVADLRFERDGAERASGAMSQAELQLLDELLDGIDEARAGVRLHDCPGLSIMLRRGSAAAAVAARWLGPAARPVRMVLFNKTAASNWALGWHQDRTIAVTERRETAGFGAWNCKAGITHVEPPFDILAGMVTLRLHLDAVAADNAPLLIAPGSHRTRVALADIETEVARCGTVACLAERGDIWTYATPILHASAAAAKPGRRRVLQVDYAAVDLPNGLRWYEAEA